MGQAKGLVDLSRLGELEMHEEFERRRHLAAFTQSFPVTLAFEAWTALTEAGAGRSPQDQSWKEVSPSRSPSRSRKAR